MTQTPPENNDPSPSKHNKDDDRLDQLLDPDKFEALSDALIDGFENKINDFISDSIPTKKVKKTIKAPDMDLNKLFPIPKPKKKDPETLEPQKTKPITPQPTTERAPVPEKEKEKEKEPIQEKTEIPRPSINVQTEAPKSIPTPTHHKPATTPPPKPTIRKTVKEAPKQPDKTITKAKKASLKKDPKPAPKEPKKLVKKSGKLIEKNYKERQQKLSDLLDDDSSISTNL